MLIHAADSSAEAVEALHSYLKIPKAKRAPVTKQAFARMPLTEGDAAKARERLWTDHLIRWETLGKRLNQRLLHRSDMAATPQRLLHRSVAGGYGCLSFLLAEPLPRHVVKRATRKGNSPVG